MVWYVSCQQQMTVNFFFFFNVLQDIKPLTTTGGPNNMTLLAEEARNLAEK